MRKKENEDWEFGMRKIVGRCARRRKN